MLTSFVLSGDCVSTLYIYIYTPKNYNLSHVNGRLTHLSLSSTSAILYCYTVYDNNNVIAVLPKFEVTLTGPSQLERDDNHFDVTVEAKYTFGEDVDGRVKINATLVSSTRKESLVIYEHTANLVWMQAKYGEASI